KLGFQFALLRLVELHAKNAFFVADANQGGEIKAHVLSAGRVLEFDFQILHRAFGAQPAVELIPLLLRLPEAQFDRASADHLFRRQGQHAEKIVIDVEEDAVQGKNAAADRALAKDGGKPFFRLLEGKLALLALGDVDGGTFNHAFAIGAADDDGAFQDP